MLDESWIYIAREQFFDMILGIRENTFKTWESQLGSMLDIGGNTFDVSVRKVDLAWGIWRGIGRMNRSQGLGEFVKETIILVDLFSKYSAMGT